MFMVVTSMFVQIFLVIFALNSIKESMMYHGTFTDDFKKFFVWLCLEAIILAAALASNALFLIVRSFYQNQNKISFPNQGRHTESDFLEAHTTEIGLINSWVTEFVVALIIATAKEHKIY